MLLGRPGSGLPDCHPHNGNGRATPSTPPPLHLTPTPHFPPPCRASQVTFRDVLSRHEHSEKVTSEVEAKRLGFYLFWNLKADFDK